jgi:hypothetical protein
MKELDSIIKKLIIVLNENKIEVTGNCLFENAVKIFISDNINNSIKNKGLKNESPNGLTDGQIYFFKKRKIDYSKLTKLEASKMIDEIKKRENNETSRGRDFSKR